MPLRLVAFLAQEGEGEVDALDLAEPSLCLGRDPAGFTSGPGRLKPAPGELGIDPGAQEWTRSGDGPGEVEVAYPAGPGWVRGDWVLLRVAGAEEQVVLFDRTEWLRFLDGIRRREFDAAARSSGRAAPAAGDAPAPPAAAHR